MRERKPNRKRLTRQLSRFVREHNIFPEFTLPEDLEEEPPCPPRHKPIEWARTNQFVEKRLEYLRGLLSRAIFVEGLHRDVLAKKWHVTPGTVMRLVGEARRQNVVLSGEDPEATRGAIAEKLSKISDIAIEKGQLMAAVTAMAKLGELVLPPRPQKLDISYEVKSLSDSELDALLLKTAQEAARMAGEAATVKLIGTSNIPDAEFSEESESLVSDMQHLEDSGNVISVEDAGDPWDFPGDEEV